MQLNCVYLSLNTAVDARKLWTESAPMLTFPAQDHPRLVANYVGGRQDDGSIREIILVHRCHVYHCTMNLGLDVWV